MEIREVSINLQLTKINLHLAHSMCAINHEWNPLFFKKHAKSINRHNDGGRRGDVIEDGKADFLRVGIDSVLNFSLHSLGVLKILESELNLKLVNPLTSRILILYRSRSHSTVFLMQE